MIVYKIGNTNRSTHFHLDKRAHRDLFDDLIDGVAEDWNALQWTEEKDIDGTFASLGGYSFVYYFDDKEAFQILNKLEDDMYLQPVSVAPPRTGYVIRVRSVIDALDLEKSDFDALDEDRIFFITKYVLKPELLKGKTLFHLKRFNGLFCTELFKEIYDKAGWTGLDLDEVWRSEE